MDDPAPPAETPSPFHAGERELQARAQMLEKMETFGARAIRPFMPDQHRDFFAQLPFMVVGGVDGQGWPWASILAGPPGFVTSPDAMTLSVASRLCLGDPLETAIRPGAALGFLGIELGTRRRNRVNGRVRSVSPTALTLHVDQSFGNCPQYIQTRSVDPLGEPAERPALQPLTTLDDAARGLIAGADTFFVASYIPETGAPGQGGVDVSHRGGRPGFVRVEGDVLTIPDYPGNFFFNTLGNFLTNPKAGLVFADFSTGELLTLTGTVELLWDGDRDVEAFKGAERAWRFTLDHGVRLAGALPFRSVLDTFSPNTLMTGDWAQAAATREAEAARANWRPYRVAKVVDESQTIRSFYLEPMQGGALAPFEAGQYLTLRATPDGRAPLVRTYTVSSAPGDPLYRISVKREAEGAVSTHLHQTLGVGDTVEAKAPCGPFFIDATEARPAVLLAGGVGITPMIAMARHIVHEGLRTRHFRPLTVFHAASRTPERAFADDFRQLEQRSEGAVRYFTFISKPMAGEQAGVEFNGAGRISAEALQQVLSLADYDVYLCGPGAFMQGLYDILRDLGVADARIFAEAFGPAALTRRSDAGTRPFTPGPEADQATIRFAKSGFEQRWNAGDATLLQTAEAHGLTPDFGCRNGACGTCAVRLLSGRVAYRAEPRAEHGPDDVLLCCAVPAEGCAMVELDL